MNGPARFIASFTRPIPRVLLIGIAVLSMADAGRAQERITDQVAVAITGNHIFGITSGQGLVRLRLNAGERMIASDARGINALAQTSDRLLAFSAPFQRWSPLNLDVTENVRHIHVSPRMILVHTTKRILGFQANRGHWNEEDLGSREIVRTRILENHVAVVVTDRRVLGFSAFTGGFFPEDLGTDEEVIHVGQNDNIIVLHTSTRQLIFRSHLAIWADLR